MICVGTVHMSVGLCASPQCPTTTLTSPSSASAPWLSRSTSCRRRAPTRPPTTRTRWPPSSSSSSTTRPSPSPSRLAFAAFRQNDSCRACSFSLSDDFTLSLSLFFLSFSARVQLLRQALRLNGEGHRSYGCQHSQRRTSIWKETKGHLIVLIFSA